MAALASFLALLLIPVLMLILVLVRGLVMILSIHNDPGTIPRLGVGLLSDIGLRPSFFLRPDDGPFLVLVLLFVLATSLAIVYVDV